MSMDEDKDGFAAEYVLGTLDAEERAQADALIAGRRRVRRCGGALGAPARRAQRAGRPGRAASAALGADQGRACEHGANRAICICPKCPRRRVGRARRCTGRRDHPDAAAHAALARLDHHHRADGGMPRRHRAGARIQARCAAARLAPAAADAGGQADRREAGRGGARGRARSAGAAPRATRRRVPEGRAVARVHPHGGCREAHADGAHRRGAAAGGPRLPDLDPAAAGRAAGIARPRERRRVHGAHHARRVRSGVISSATYGISLEPVGGSPTGRPTSPAIHARLVQATP